MTNTTTPQLDQELTYDEEVRRLVLARLQVISSDTIKCIGSEGSFSRDELIEHVKLGDKMGKTIEQIEMEWLRALKNGLINELYT
jgi:hypothetical protein